MPACASSLRPTPAPEAQATSTASRHPSRSSASIRSDARQQLGEAYELVAAVCRRRACRRACSSRRSSRSESTTGRSASRPASGTSAIRSTHAARPRPRIVLAGASRQSSACSIHAPNGSPPASAPCPDAARGPTARAPARPWPAKCSSDQPPHGAEQRASLASASGQLGDREARRRPGARPPARRPRRTRAGRASGSRPRARRGGAAPARLRRPRTTSDTLARHHDVDPAQARQRRPRDQVEHPVRHERQPAQAALRRAAHAASAEQLVDPGEHAREPGLGLEPAPGLVQRRQPVAVALALAREQLEPLQRADVLEQERPAGRSSSPGATATRRSR